MMGYRPARPRMRKRVPGGNHRHAQLSVTADMLGIVRAPHAAE